VYFVFEILFKNNYFTQHLLLPIPLPIVLNLYSNFVNRHLSKVRMLKD